MRKLRKALRMTRHELQRILSRVDIRIYLKDSKRRFLWANSATLKAHGLRSLAELVGKRDEDFFTDKHASDARKDELRIVRTGTAIIDKQEEEVWLTNSVRTSALTSKYALCDDSGHVVMILGMSKDMTLPLKEEQDRQARELAHTISHALGNWLGTLQLNCDALREMYGEVEELCRLQRGIEFLSHVCRITTGLAALNGDLELRPESLNRLLDEVVRVRGDARLKPVPSQRGLQARISKAHLVLAVTELLANAERFTPSVEDGGRIRVWVDGDRTTCRIHVRDNGRGLDPGLDYEKIFEPSVTTQRGVHPGLGLHYARTIARMHSGDAVVRRHRAGVKGAHFVIELPAVSRRTRKKEREK